MIIIAAVAVNSLKTTTLHNYNLLIIHLHNIQMCTTCQPQNINKFRKIYIGWHDRSWTILNGKLTMLQLLNIYQAAISVYENLMQ